MTALSAALDDLARRFRIRTLEDRQRLVQLAALIDVDPDGALPSSSSWCS
jgi:hypothetical protein